VTSPRSYLRHPSDIPIDVLPAQVDAGDTRVLHNVSHGGLSFSADQVHASGEIVRMRITLVSPVFEAVGKVVWCHGTDGHYIVGVEFLDEVDLFRARMVEQICHIEHYKKSLFEKEGRRLTSQEAALEWISKYAGDFPNSDNDTKD
jgi:hypothetical protein